MTPPAHDSSGADAPEGSGADPGTPQRGSERIRPRDGSDDEPRSTHVDGRRAKGERRRRALIDATLRVLERDGAVGVSHRNIAREAGVATASIAYYFDGIDDLLVATLLDTVDSVVGQLGKLREEVEEGASWVRALAEMLAAMVREHRDRTLAEYELYLLAARRPALRPAARRWLEVAADQVDGGAGVDAGMLRAFVAALDGLLIQGLIADRPPSAEDFEPALRFLVRPGEHLRDTGAR